MYSEQHIVIIRNKNYNVCSDGNQTFKQQNRLKPGKLQVQKHNYLIGDLLGLFHYLKNRSNEFEAICCEPQIFCLKFVQKAREQLQFCEMAKSVERVWWFLYNMVVGRRSLMLLYCVVLCCIVLYCIIVFYCILCIVRWFA